ncbi:MAG: hypothetical protein PHD53_05525 [Methylococcales bacterium]|nr:hypothetical protein [Methylococcales bacterium]
MPIHMPKLTLALTIALTLSGCSVMRSYDDELKQTVDLVSQGEVSQALQQLDSNNTSNDKDLLYYFEKGTLQRFDNKYKDSVTTWLSADHLVNEWENEAKIRAGAILENIGSVTLNDKTRRYDGHDYEKVMLSTQLALSHLLNGDWDFARTEIKKTHERESIIADVRAKETDAIEKESKEKGIGTTFKDLNGYPVETLNSPEIMSLKNGYQSAFSHYLAGFVYEALDEPSLASAGYRQAIELRPNVKILEDGLAGLDSRPHQHKPNETDVLMVVESGVAPSLTSVSIPIPVIYKGLGVIPISFPVLHSDPTHTTAPITVSVDNVNTQPLSMVTSLDAMSKRALKDDMQGIILRGILRAAIKGASQQALMGSNNGYAMLAGVALNAVNVITESADERTWRTLPSTINVARFSIPTGKHEFSLSSNKKTLDINGAHTLVVARVISNQVYWSQPVYTAKMPANIIAPPAPQIEPQIVQKKAVSKKVSKSSTKKRSKK